MLRFETAFPFLMIFIMYLIFLFITNIPFVSAQCRTIDGDGCECGLGSIACEGCFVNCGDEDEEGRGGREGEITTTTTISPFDFSISVSPSSASVQPGQNAVATATATLLVGPTQPVSFTCPEAFDGRPPGVSCNFSPPSCNPTCSSTMTVSTSVNSPTGNYNITVRGDGGGVSRIVNFTLALGTCLVNSRCDNFGGGNENQQYCPQDCFTGVTMQPDIGLQPGQEVTVTMTFNDSRYTAGHVASYSLTIDGAQWTSANGCIIAGRNVTPQANGTGTACTWTGVNATCTSTSVNGYLKVVTKCNLPTSLTGYTHVFTAIPTFYSRATVLNEGVTKFTLAQTVGMIDLIQQFFNAIVSILIK